MTADTIEIKKFSGLLVCRIGSAELCFDMKNLVLIADPPSIDKMKGDNNSLEYGGFLFQFIHIHKFYNLELTSSDFTKLILLEIKGKTICFLVDQVLEMIAAGERTFEALVYLKSDSPYLNGTILYEGREILVPCLLNIIEKNLTD